MSNVKIHKYSIWEQENWQGVRDRPTKRTKGTWGKKQQKHNTLQKSSKFLSHHFTYTLYRWYHTIKWYHYFRKYCQYKLLQFIFQIRVLCQRRKKISKKGFYDENSQRNPWISLLDVMTTRRREKGFEENLRFLKDTNTFFRLISLEKTSEPSQYVFSMPIRNTLFHMNFSHKWQAITNHIYHHICRILSKIGYRRYYYSILHSTSK